MKRPGRRARYALLVAAAHAQTSVAPSGQPSAVPASLPTGAAHHRAADGHAVISTHGDAAADADARARTDACTDNGPHGGPFLGAVVDADRGAQHKPDYNKGADARRRRRDRVVRLPGQKKLRPAADEPVVVLRRARGRSCSVWARAPSLRRAVCAAAAARDSKIADAGPRVRERQAAGARRAAPGRGVPVG